MPLWIETVNQMRLINSPWLLPFLLPYWIFPQPIKIGVHYYNWHFLRDETQHILCPLRFSAACFGDGYKALTHINAQFHSFNISTSSFTSDSIFISYSSGEQSKSLTACPISLKHLSHLSSFVLSTFFRPSVIIIELP